MIENNESLTLLTEDKNDTKSREQNSAIMALAAATSDLANAINALNYTPTVWNDWSEPDIDAEHMNKIENGIFSAVEAIKLSANAISAINGNLSKLTTGVVNPDSPKDANLYTDTGAYTIGNPATWKNLPAGDTPGTFLVRNFGVYISQTYISVNTNDLFIRTSFDSGQTWISWTHYVTNNDLTARFNPIQIDGTKGNTFASVLKNKMNFSVNFIAFYGNNTYPIPDNPFSFQVGYGIVLHTGMIHSNNTLTIVGVPAIGGNIETKRITL